MPNFQAVFLGRAVFFPLFYARFLSLAKSPAAAVRDAHYPQTFKTQDDRADGFPRRPASAFGTTCERLILTRLLVDSICSPGWSPADLEGVVKDERAAASATRGETRHPALRIATAINMVMQRSDRREPICGTRQAPGHGGCLGGLKETRGKALISSCDLAHKERGPRPMGGQGGSAAFWPPGSPS